MKVEAAAAQIRELRKMKLGEAHWADMPIGFQNPHCDFAMVHAPGECSSCDGTAFGLQHLRYINNMNFTGHHDPDKAPCPAEIFRTFENANKWGGNYAEVNAEVPLEGTEEQRRAGRWMAALSEFQAFYKKDRELRKLWKDREELERKIRQLDYKP